MRGPPRSPPLRHLGMYEVFEHTADVGMRVTAARLDDLYAWAARGLLSLLIENPDDVRRVQRIEFCIAGDDAANLLLDWLTELLYTFESRRLLVADCHVTVDADGIRATAAGEPFDETRHRLRQEIKAVTYHGLQVTQIDGQWHAEVILDL